MSRQAFLLKDLHHEGKQITNNYHAHISVPQVQEKETGSSQRPVSQKAAPKCSICGYFTKGHKNVSSCPKNQKKQTVLKNSMPFTNSKNNRT